MRATYELRQYELTNVMKFDLGEENDKRYFVATQDKQLRNTLRKIPGVPLLYINYNCIVMEKPSFVCVKKASEVINGENCYFSLL